MRDTYSNLGRTNVRICSELLRIIRISQDKDKISIRSSMTYIINMVNNEQPRVKYHRRTFNIHSFVKKISLDIILELNGIMFPSKRCCIAFEWK